MPLPNAIGAIVNAQARRLDVLASLQSLLPGCRNDSARKTLATAAYETGVISGAECELLLQAHMLETA